MITQDPISISPLQIVDSAKEILTECIPLAQGFVAWLESCTDQPFDDESERAVIHNVMTFATAIAQQSSAILLKQLLSENDSKALSAEIEEYTSIVDAMKDITDELPEAE
jgi:hypothetical protein